MVDICINFFWINFLQKILKIILKNLGVCISKFIYNQYVVLYDEGWVVKGVGNECYIGVYIYQCDVID